MKKALCAIALVAATCALTGCGVTHQVVSAENVCISCHDSSRYLVADATFDTSGAVYSATGELSVTVVGNKSFYICVPYGSSAGDNGTPIPLLQKGPITVTDGEAYAITLDAGWYMILTQVGSDVASQLVYVDPNTTEETTDAITLKL